MDPMIYNPVVVDRFLLTSRK